MANRLTLKAASVPMSVARSGGYNGQQADTGIGNGSAKSDGFLGTLETVFQAPVMVTQAVFEDPLAAAQVVGGVVLTVGSFGTASAAGVGLIAKGGARLAGQTVQDIAVNESLNDGGNYYEHLGLTSTGAKPDDLPTNTGIVPPTIGGVRIPVSKSPAAKSPVATNPVSSAPIVPTAKQAAQVKPLAFGGGIFGAIALAIAFL